MILQGRFQGLRHSPQWAGQIHCVCTSPPYNADVPYLGYRDRLSDVQYMDLAMDFAKTMDHCCAAGAPVFVNLAPVMARDPLQTLRWLQEVCREIWDIHNWITWLKSGTTPDGQGGEVSWGHFTPITSDNRLHSTWEWVVQLRRKAENPRPINRLAVGTPYADESNVKRFGKEGRANLRCRGNTWSIPYRTKPNKQKNAHPAQFPEDLVDNCLALADLSPEQIVLDPFAGSCRAAEPCFRRGLRFLGVELCPVYAEQSQVDLMALSALYDETEKEVPDERL
jgi:DNA modification methylase